MWRCRITYTVRGLPVHRSGTTNGKPWAFLSVPVLDDDFNKGEVTLADDVSPALFVEGVKLDCLVDVSASGGRLRTQVLQAKDVARAASANPPAAANRAA
jgi:hypothetical protein